MDKNDIFLDEPPKKRKRFINTWIALLILLLIAGSSFLGFATSFVLSRFSAIEMLFMLSPSEVQLAEKNILILGVDATEGVKRSDTIMVVHVDPLTNNIGIVIIPRDTLVAIPGIGLDKINHAYAFGGPELACATTSNFLGVPVKEYIKINVDGLEKIVDLLGGITIDVEKRMYYADYRGNLLIDLKPGLQKLSGKKAMGYLRFRSDASGDIGRINRQQKFLQQIASKMAQTKNPVKLYRLVMSLLECVETNIPTPQIISLSTAINQIYEIGNIAMASLPCSPIMIDGIFYLQPDMPKITNIANEYLKGKPSGENAKKYIR